jgi:hypothetical protein
VTEVVAVAGLLIPATQEGSIVELAGGGWP